MHVDVAPIEVLLFSLHKLPPVGCALHILLTAQQIIVRTLNRLLRQDLPVVFIVQNNSKSKTRLMHRHVCEPKKLISQACTWEDCSCLPD